MTLHNDRDAINTGGIIDGTLAGEFLLALQPIMPLSVRRDAMLAHLLNRIRSTNEIAPVDFLTVRADEGAWATLTPLVQMKVLRSDKRTHSRSFLLRFAPGGSLPAHEHFSDEECMVLEGEAQLGDISVQAGDYHLAPKGRRHGVISSNTGALLFLRTSATRPATPLHTC